MRTNEPILSISVAANLLRLHQRTLMLYEKSGLIRPYRTSTKRRLFSSQDLERLQLIKYLTQERGINLSGTKIILEALDYTEKKGVELNKHLFPDFKSRNLI